MGPVACFRADNATEAFNKSLPALQSQANAVAEDTNQPAVKAGHAERRKAKRLFPAVDFDTLSLGPDLLQTWLEAIRWAARLLNRAPTKENTGGRSAHEVYYCHKPPLQVIPFMQPQPDGGKSFRKS